LSQNLLVVGSGIETIPGIQRAKDMGVHVVASDVNPKAPGFRISDDSIIADTYGVNETVDAAIHYHKTIRPIDGVICIASDVPLTVASVANALGLPGISIQTARLAADKLAMKRKFVADGVKTPWFSSVENEKHLRSLVNKQGYPLVLKPVDSRGARGVLRLTPDIDLMWAYKLSHGFSPTGRVMIERFMEGPQVSTESIVLDGVAYTVGFSDRNYEYLERYSPHIIENGGELPSCLSADIQDKCRRLVQQAALSMGIVNGVVKGDIVVCEGQPYVIELAARLSGGYFCTHEIPLNTGVDFVGQAIRLALGTKLNPADMIPQYHRGVAQRYLFSKPGRVTSISDISKFLCRSDIPLCEIRVSQGDIIGPIDSHPARAGVIITTGETRDQAIERAMQVVNAIKIETADDRK
jgi:biotin carboxylase